jgi:hypothetical protein
MSDTLAHTDRSPGDSAATDPATVAAKSEPATLQSLSADVASMRAELARLVEVAEGLAVSAGHVTAQLSKGGLSGIMGLLMGQKS